MRILYYDCFSGISGDMNLGAMVDLGVDAQWLIEELYKLPIRDSFQVSFEKQEKMGITGTKAHVKEIEHEHPHRHLKDVYQIIEDSSLSDSVKQRSKDMFLRIAQAEGAVHGTAPEMVHFHEVGAIDSIVDVVGAALCFDWWKVNKVFAGPVQVGGGFVRCAHGLMPVPAPATVELLKGIPIKSGAVDGETTTPTGAAILTHGVDEFVQSMTMDIVKVGYGLGTKDFSIPNVLRVYLAEVKEHPIQDTQVMLEANLDDMNPEFYGYVEEKLFEGGALDVFKTQIIMKKSRPAVKLSVLCPVSKADELKKVLFLQTTTLGIRSYPVEKTMLDRKIFFVNTPWGPVDVKVGIFEGKPIKFKAEYDQCVAIARAHHVDLAKVYKEVYRTLEEFHDES